MLGPLKPAIQSARVVASAHPKRCSCRADTSEIDIPDHRLRATVDLFGEIIVPDRTYQKVLRQRLFLSSETVVVLGGEHHCGTLAAQRHRLRSLASRTL